jgi:hypothetical protein
MDFLPQTPVNIFFEESKLTSGSKSDDAVLAVRKVHLSLVQETSSCYDKCKAELPPTAKSYDYDVYVAQRKFYKCTSACNDASFALLHAQKKDLYETVEKIMSNQ